MAGISSKALSFGSPENKKGFNGNELQNKEFSDDSGLDLYDFNARTYDQQIGRFTEIDPLFEDGQESLTPYHFSYNNPISFSDPDGKFPDGCCDFGEIWQDVKDGARQVTMSTLGAINAWSSNQIGGAGRVDPNKQSGLTDSDKKAVATGQAVGDVASIVTGFVEMVGSGAAELVTFGTASPVAIPVAVHGGSSILMGTKNLVDQSGKVNVSSNNPYGSKGKPDHQQKVSELAKKAQKEIKPGETVLQERKIQGQDSRRRPDVQIVDKNGRTRKVFEAERKPASQRNIKREQEYKKLKVDQETHKVGQ